ncbi:hypothetical protein K441DRAFT_582019 [Neofusicoccum parvum]|nr:hypothetical protein K441DRAFT_582019 [Neofusicoccum parvum]
MDSYGYNSKKAAATYYTPSSSSQYYASSAATASSSMRPSRGYGSKPTTIVHNGGGQTRDPPDLVKP